MALCMMPSVPCGEVGQQIKLCAAMEERKHVQRRENLFSANSHLRFRIQQRRGKSQCTRLRVDGALISDPSHVLDVWTQHFQSLAKSQEDTKHEIKELLKELTTLLSVAFQKEEVFLDVPFTIEEVGNAVNRMKLIKSADLMAEYLKYGGRSIVMWLTGILNSIVEVEQVPTSLKLGTTIPIYKGGGRILLMSTVTGV